MRRLWSLWIFNTTQACALGIQETGDRYGWMKVPVTLPRTLTLTSWTEMGPASEWSGQSNLYVKELEVVGDFEPNHRDGGGLSHFDTKTWKPSLWERKKCCYSERTAYLELVGIKQMQYMWQVQFKIIKWCIFNCGKKRHLMSQLALRMVVRITCRRLWNVCLTKHASGPHTRWWECSSHSDSAASL